MGPRTPDAVVSLAFTMSSISPAKPFPSSAPAIEDTTPGSLHPHTHSGADFTHHHRQYSEAEWQTKKLLIKQLYMDAKKPLKQVMLIMAQKHDFHPTRKMYVKHLETWGFAKNCTQARVIQQLRQKRGRDALNKVSKIGREEGKMDRRRIKKYLARTKKAGEISAAVEREGDVKSSDEASMHSPPRDPDPTTYPSAHGDYEHNCPYSQWTKKFRLIEEFPGGSRYEGDSFGFHSYIATDEERPCTEHCFCHQHGVSKAFSFMVYKSSSKMDITIFSDDLYSNLLEVLDSTGSQIGFTDDKKIVNGLDLLKHYPILKSHLGNHVSNLPDSPMIHSPFSEMELLVEGLLADGEVFASFGYEDLYECGFLDFKTWKKFQQVKLQRDISALEEGFWEVDSDLEEFLALPMQQNSSGQQSMDSEFAFDELSDTEELLASPEHPQPDDVWPPDFEGTANQANDSEKLPTFAEESNPLGEWWFKFPLIHAANAGQVAVVKLLLDRGADINLEVRCPLGFTISTPLITAAKAGQVAVVELLLDRGADINLEARCPLGFTISTPLITAAKAGQVAVVELLLDRGADIHLEALPLGFTRFTPLATAAKAGQVAVVELLLDRGADINWEARCPLGFTRSTPLITAANAGQVAVVKLLLDRGADINLEARCPLGFTRSTPLITAANAGQVAVVQLLLDRGADVDKSGGRRTPLAEAAKAGHLAVVQLLLQYGVDVDKSGEWCTPLVEAIKAGHITVVQLLLQHGADVDKSGGWYTPLAEAAKAGHIAVVELLLDRGADINERSDWSGSHKTPLLDAVEGGHVAVVQLLLDRGGGIHTDGYGSLAACLGQAAYTGRVKIVKLLLDRGADINERSGCSGKTPLLQAAEEANVRVVQLLLDRGADTHVSGCMLWIKRLAKAVRPGSTALKRLLQNRLIVAAATGRTEEMRALLQNGVDINAITPCGTALSTAVRSGYETSIRWLLRKGADVHAAAAILQRFDDAKFTTARLFKSEAWVRDIEYARNNMRLSRRHDSRRAKNLLYLHSRFTAQHRLMIDASRRSSTGFRELSQTFPRYREAWSAGIRTLRSLCGGAPPINLSNTIAFLCLAKAISEALQELGGCDRSEQFLLDLDRWQLIFKSKADSDPYRDAVYSMWGVTLDENLSNQNQVDSDDLLYFQELASTLVSHASESFDFDAGTGALNDTGLGASQQRWQLRNEMNPPGTNSSAIPPGSIQTTDAQPPEFVPPLPPDPQVRSTERNLSQAVAADISSATIEPIVTLLMAGMIFALVVIFLHWLENISAGTPTIFAYIDTLQERCRVLEMYMGVKRWVPYGASGEFTSSGKGMVQVEDYFDFASYFA
ncbi:multiple ankyrin repeats single kh domain protein [Rutstroemia sp. NJR-2017a BVV2]|nr:multiple ankyrin repeats single kh domain protein [Rutstroemia sp. NJR-2017a BVV2]